VFGWYINLTGSVLLTGATTLSPSLARDSADGRRGPSLCPPRVRLLTGATALSPLLARDSANERRGTSLCPPLVLLLAGATALSPLLARDRANERRGTSLCPPCVRLLTGEKRHPPSRRGTARVDGVEPRPVTPACAC
jgi:hypothetical protein